MPAVGFVSPKGGAGKTTAALVLALEIAARGSRVALIDSDPNRPLVHWSALPGRPDRISIHPAPTIHDIRDALREAQRRSPDWIILDTEGSIRGAMAFRALRLDLIITPLAASQLEALQAIKASELVEAATSASNGMLRHRCLLTRVPAAIRTRALGGVVAQLQAKGIELLPTPLLEKEAFRALFAFGGGFDAVEAAGVSGVAAARKNAALYFETVTQVIGQAPDDG